MSGGNAEEEARIARAGGGGGHGEMDGGQERMNRGNRRRCMLRSPLTLCTHVIFLSFSLAFLYSFFLFSSESLLFFLVSLSFVLSFSLC